MLFFFFFIRFLNLRFYFDDSEVRGSKVHINLSASEILKLADRIIDKSKKVHDAVASIPLDKVMKILPFINHCN